MKSILPTLICLITSVHALELTSPFSSNAILPMESTFNLTGKSAKGATIIASFNNKTIHGSVNADKTWFIPIPPLTADSNPKSLTITSGTETITLNNLLVGKLYLFSGQSNMDFALRHATGGKQELNNTNSETPIRILHYPASLISSRAFNKSQLQQLTTQPSQPTWKLPTKPNIAPLSAIAWWTAKTLQQKSNIPIGIIENAVGGTGTEAWLDPITISSNKYPTDFINQNWLNHAKISPWARNRAKTNLANSGITKHPFQPGFSFNQSLPNWRGIPLAGVIWYQGETNAELNLPKWNAQLLSDLITGWRKHFNQPDLPFYIIQLPNIGGNDPIRRFWPQYRAIQANIAKTTPNTILIPTQDLGYKSPNVHPPDKKPIALRLAETILTR